MVAGHCQERSSDVKTVERLCKGLNFVSVVMIAAMVIMITADVIGRALFNRPVPGALEMLQYMLVVTVYFSLGWAALSGRHVKLDFLVSRFPTRLRTVTDSTMHLIGIVMLAFFAWQAIVAAEDARRLNLVSSVLEIPRFPFFYALAVGCAGFALAIVVIWVKDLRKVVKR
jgi:TRAP-type C4-dicarboxylate transport system permease small subunit